MQSRRDSSCWSALAMIMAAVLTSCGGSTMSHTTSLSVPTAPVAITVTPAQANVAQGGTVTFAASTSVTWSVQEGSAGGSISTAGVYTAPNAAGTYHIVATGPASTAVATVIVPTVSISVSQNSIRIALNATYPMSTLVSVQGTVNTALGWSVQEGATGGTINGAGMYTAPGTAGAYHVLVQSAADATVKGMIAVDVVNVSATISPSSEILGPLGVRQFYGWSNTSDGSVNWSIQEGTAGGTLGASGTGVELYTAPPTPGTYHVIVSAVAAPTGTATATVTVLASGFRPSSNTMQQARSAPTATVLADGTVLIAGGDGCIVFSYYGGCPLASAEIYDPATDSFTSLASTMPTTRVFHTATRLGNGKVLLVGGSTSSADLYDPAAKTFTATGSMSTIRGEHTAALLPNGKVLIAGGYGLYGALATAEIYDPASGTFTPTGAMTTARADHTATLLAEGTVLIAGGTDGTSDLITTEIFDPSTGTFTAAGNMTTARRLHAATLLLNGSVLLTGGMSNNQPTASAEIYDPATKKFSGTQQMQTARDSHFAVLLPSGKVVVAGGNNSGTLADVFDPATKLFNPTGSLFSDHILGAACLLLDGRVFVAGGSDGNIAEIYK